MRIVAPPGVFTPRSDSWMLAEIAQAECLPGMRVLDVCTGSGAIAIAAALAGAQASAVDVSRRSVVAARVNAVLNGVQVEALRGDLFGPVAGREFDLIVSNPPYLPGEELPARGEERAWEGGPGGRAFIDRIVREAPAHLATGGALLMIHSEVCGTEATLAAMSRAGLDAAVIRRYEGPPGPLLAERAPELESEEIVVVRAAKIGAPVGVGM